MTKTEITINQQREHLVKILQAIPRCIYFLESAIQDVSWPVSGEFLENNKLDKNIFGSLSIINERFAKLQDLMGSVMRHSMNLLSENVATFLDVLAFYEKQGVIVSIDGWINTRNIRNIATHDYETDYDSIAEHFNAIHGEADAIIFSAKQLISFCQLRLNASIQIDEFTKLVDINV